MTVPFVDLKTSHRALADEILSVWREILCDAAFIGGPQVDGFEREFEAFTGARHCVGVANGTDALRFAILAMGVGPGDEVITVPHTFIATTEAISQAGARPVFVDVDRATGTLDPTRLEAALTERTKLIVPVHLYGQPADMDPILAIARPRGIRVLEDAAQAHGARYHGRSAGTLADAASFSFYPGKNLGACGEAGAVVTDDAGIAEQVKVLRDHGQSAKYHHRIEGYNGRLDAIQAAALRIKLRHLASWNAQRHELAGRYHERLAKSGLELPLEAPDRGHVYHLYVVRHPQRDLLRERLGAAGIGSGLHYPIPLHLQPAYAHLELAAGTFPESERWAGQGLSLPMFPGMTAEQLDRVCEAIAASGLAEG
jgi:dTDP-4-amino-4,6-dideoxygalactose transaminase